MAQTDWNFYIDRTATSPPDTDAEFGSAVLTELSGTQGALDDLTLYSELQYNNASNPIAVGGTNQLKNDSGYDNKRIRKFGVDQTQTTAYIGALTNVEGYASNIPHENAGFISTKIDIDSAILLWDNASNRSSTSSRNHGFGILAKVQTAGIEEQVGDVFPIFAGQNCEPPVGSSMRSYYLAFNPGTYAGTGVSHVNHNYPILNGISLSPTIAGANSTFATENGGELNDFHAIQQQIYGATRSGDVQQVLRGGYGFDRGRWFRVKLSVFTEKNGLGEDIKDIVEVYLADVGQGGDGQMFATVGTPPNWILIARQVIPVGDPLHVPWNSTINAGGWMFRKANSASDQANPRVYLDNFQISLTDILYTP